MLPGIALLVYAAWEADRRVREGVRAEAQRAGRLLADEQQRSVESARGLLAGLSHITALAAPVDARRCDPMLAAIARESTIFNNLSLADMRGTVVCSAVPAGPGVNLAERAHFRGVLESRSFTAGEYAVGRINGRPSFYFAAPVLREDGTVEAVVTAGLDLVELQRRLDAQTLPEGAVAVIADSRGVLLARRPAAQGVGAEWSSPLLAQLRNGASAQAELEDDDGVRRAYALEPVPGVGGKPAMLVALGLPTEAAQAQLRDLFTRTLLGFGGLAIIAIVAALSMGEILLVRRIDVITRAARRLARGDLRARTGLAAGAGELDQLGAAFDDMARSIERLSRQNALILDSASEGLLGLDRDGRITFANPAAARALARPATDLMGRAVRELLAPGEAPVLEPGEERAAGSPSESAPRQLAATFSRRDGTLLPVEYAVSKVSEGGADLGAVLAFRDVTEGRRLEEQLRQAQKMEAVGQLAGGIAHDFNNLLTAILSFGRFVRDDLGAGHPSAPDVDEILGAAERAAGLTRQLLAFSRRQVLEPRVVDLGATVRGLEKMLRRLIGEAISLETRLAAGAGKVKADPGHLEQVILNLVVNARDAMPSGGRLSIAVDDAPPAEAAALEEGPSFHRGELVRLTISDSGVGMDEQTAKRMFEPFFTTKPAGKGTGLGLSTVYGIVTQSGGAIRVESAPGKGTTFHVYLPRAAETSPAARGGTPEAHGEAPRAPADGTETVLLVEDDAPVRTLARRVLEGAGYQVAEAARPREAIDIVMGYPERIHLLLTDVILPEMRGPALAKHILGMRPGVRVLYTSGYTGGQIESEEVSSSGHAFLAKPFTPDELLRRVREVLDAPA